MRAEERPAISAAASRMRFAAFTAVLLASIGIAGVRACPNAKLLEPFLQTIAGTGAPGTTNGPVTRATFVGPVGVALGSDGSIYVADEFGQDIRQIKDGIVRTVAGASAAASSPQQRIGGYRDGPAATDQPRQLSSIIRVVSPSDRMVPSMSRILLTFAFAEFPEA